MAKGPWISRDRGVDERRFALQKALVEKHFPGFECRLARRCLECEGSITPSEECGTYWVSISYQRGGIPRVKIKDPQIIPSSAIHVYANGTLCLYEPRDTPWKASDNLHEKIIPWTAEWLVFYELFLIYGKWLGPEAPHSTVRK